MVPVEGYSAFCLRTQLALAERVGVEPADLLAPLRYTPEALCELGVLVPPGVEDGVLAEAARRLGDPTFNLRMSGAIEAESMDIYGYYLACAPTVEAALQRLAWVTDAALDPGRIRLEPVAGGALGVVLEPRLVEAHLSPRMVEFRLASVVRLTQAVTRDVIAPVRVSFRRPCPEYADAFAGVFGAPVVFGAPRNELVFGAETLMRRGWCVDPGLSKVLRSHLERLLGDAAAGGSAGLVARVERALESALAARDASLEGVARRLGLRPRTLQHHLRAAGVSFRVLLNRRRMALACRYLRDLGLPVGEVAFRLGFNHVESFRRAFRSAMGTSPARYRQEDETPPAPPG